MIPWADTMATQRFSSDDTLAVSFQEDTTRKDGAIGPRNTPFFAVCFKYVDAGPDGRNTAMWYDVAHVEGSPAEA